MDRPSIVLISIDALRADCAPGADDSLHLRSLGLRRPALPSLTALVHGAVAFTQAIAHGSYTPSCHASMFTGLLPPEHGVRAFSVTAISRHVRTLAEIVRDAGYATCAMSDQPSFFQPQGLGRGFQTFVTAEEEALAWWDSYQDQPRLLFLHLWDVHQPYSMPVARSYRSSYPAIVAAWQQRLRTKGLAAPEREEAFYEDPDRYYVGLMQQIWQNVCGFKAACQDYLAGLETFDRGRLKDLLAALRERRILDEALLVVTADHGEGRDVPPSTVMKHGSTLLDDQVRVPLFIRAPLVPALVQPAAAVPGLPRSRAGYGQYRGPAALRVTEQVAQSDLTPTILDMVGLHGAQSPGLSPYSGRSLSPLLQGGRLAERPVYAEIWSSSRRARDDTLVRTLDAEQDAPQIAPRHRMLRYPNRKYYLVGQPGALSDEVLPSNCGSGLTGPGGQFVDALFRHMLGRFATTEENAMWLERVNKTAPADVEGRRALVQRFAASAEFRTFPKHGIFDLAQDPLEEKPRDAQRSPTDWADYEQALAVMLEIDSHARTGEPLVTSEADEQVILKRLQDLGYLE